MAFALGEFSNCALYLVRSDINSVMYTDIRSYFSPMQYDNWTVLHY